MGCSHCEQSCWYVFMHRCIVGGGRRLLWYCGGDLVQNFWRIFDKGSAFGGSSFNCKKHLSGLEALDDQILQRLGEVVEAMITVLSSAYVTKRTSKKKKNWDRRNKNIGCKYLKKTSKHKWQQDWKHCYSVTKDKHHIINKIVCYLFFFCLLFGFWQVVSLFLNSFFSLLLSSRGGTFEIFMLLFLWGVCRR